MISLGTYDENVSKNDLAAYQKYVKKITNAVALPEWNHQLREEGKWVDYAPINAADEMKVAALQQFLHDAETDIAESADDDVPALRNAPQFQGGA